MLNKLILKLRKYVEKAGVNGVVFGMSGGIDSTVVAYLAKKALSDKKVLAMIMPWRYTPKKDTKDAIKIAEKLGIEYKIENIDHIVEKLDTGLDRISLGNLAARIRMTILYREANSQNLLVLGTSNRTELELGYYTKYGDGGADLLPLGSLYKTDVRILAKKLGVPNYIINKKPTAGLWNGQTDEDELGFTYEKIDKKLKKRDKNGLEKWVEKAKHKKGPIVLKI